MCFASFFCLRLALAGQPATLNSMVCLPLAGAFCRRFRVAWRSFKHLAAVKLYDDATCLHCDLILIDAVRSARCELGVFPNLPRSSLLPEPSTRFFRDACLKCNRFSRVACRHSFSSCVHPISPSLRSDPRRLFCSWASSRPACTYRFHPVRGQSIAMALVCKPMEQRCYVCD